jgi:hypothetical protein
MKMSHPSHEEVELTCSFEGALRRVSHRCIGINGSTIGLIIDVSAASILSSSDTANEAESTVIAI